MIDDSQFLLRVPNARSYSVRFACEYLKSSPAFRPLACSVKIIFYQKDFDVTIPGYQGTLCVYYSVLHCDGATLCYILSVVRESLHPSYVMTSILLCSSDTIDHM